MPPLSCASDHYAAIQLAAAAGAEGNRSVVVDPQERVLRKPAPDSLQQLLCVLIRVHPYMHLPTSGLFLERKLGPRQQSDQTVPPEFFL